MWIEKLTCLKIILHIVSNGKTYLPSRPCGNLLHKPFETDQLLKHTESQWNFKIGECCGLQVLRLLVGQGWNIASRTIFMCFFSAVFLPHLDIALCTIVKCTHSACYITKSDMKRMNNCFLKCEIHLCHIMFYGQALAHVHPGHGSAQSFNWTNFFARIPQFLVDCFPPHPDSSRCSNGPSDWVHHHHLHTSKPHHHSLCQLKWSPTGN